MHSATDARYLAATGGPAYERLAARYATLGYRGHPITKTHRYSTTFKALRQARRDWHTHRRPAGVSPVELPPDEDPDGQAADVIVESQWAYAGAGYLTTEQAARALASAMAARQRARRTQP